jgi:hypothetical protein
MDPVLAEADEFRHSNAMQPLPSTPRKPWYRILYVQVLVAVAISRREGELPGTELRRCLADPELQSVR